MSDRQRSTQTSHAPRPKSTQAAEPLRRLVTIAKIEVGPWGRTPDLQRNFEETCVTALLTDGKLDTRWASITFAHGEREMVMEAIANPANREADAKATRALQGILCRRASAVQRARGDLERMYANGVAA